MSLHAPTLRGGGYRCAVWDITTDVGAAAFQCMLSIEPATRACRHRRRLSPGEGIALLRALTEAAQVRTTYIVGSREDIQPVDYDPTTLARRNVEARKLMRARRVRRFEFRSTASNLRHFRRRSPG